MNEITLHVILDNLRGAGNVGSILRTADAVGASTVYACGYTPYPRVPGDTRPPHVIASNERQIAKTALGADQTMSVLHVPDTLAALAEAKRNGFITIVVEQAETSLNLFDYAPPRGARLAVVLGNETGGVAPEVQHAADLILELPMVGQKESLGVAVAAGIALYHLTRA